MDGRVALGKLGEGDSTGVPRIETCAGEEGRGSKSGPERDCPQQKLEHSWSH